MWAQGAGSGAASLGKELYWGGRVLSSLPGAVLSGTRGKPRSW